MKIEAKRHILYDDAGDTICNIGTHFNGNGVTITIGKKAEYRGIMNVGEAASLGLLIRDILLSEFPDQIDFDLVND